jgi:glycogen(starch) synthase
MRHWPRHVFMTADTLGGVWTFAIELTRALIKRGLDVTLAITGGPLTDDQRAQARAPGGPAIFESSFRLEWQDDPWKDVDRAGEWLQEIAAAVKPDLVHLNDYSNASLRWDIPVVVTGHSCVLSWFRAVHKSQAPPLWNEYRRRVERGLHSADIVTAPSHAMLDSLEHNYGSLAHTMVIPNGRAASEFRADAKEPFILAAGRIWDEAKNIASLARIAGRLPWRVYVAGEQRRAALENVTSLGLLSQTDLASWMSRASIYCLPAKYEPFGLSILEAALSGCALVLGDIGSLRENWEDCACFVDPHDPTSLYETSMQLIRSEPLRRKLAVNALERARRFSPEQMVEGYLQAYQTALASAEELTLAARAPA